MTEVLYQGLARYFSPARLETLRRARVGIAGCGGLGSNVALMLARCGVGHLLLADADVVDASNLNRQQFWPRHVGRPKAEALAELLQELNPALEADARRLLLTPETLPDLLPCCPVWVEALDDPASKALFVERALAAGRQVIAASGLAGWGGAAMGVRRCGRLVVAGDFVTGIDTAPPVAPRVTQAAALQADAVLELLLGPCHAEEGGVPARP